MLTFGALVAKSPLNAFKESKLNNKKMSDRKHASKIQEKWSMIAQLSFSMGDEEDNKTNPSTKEADSVITEQKIDKVRDWL